MNRHSIPVVDKDLHQRSDIERIDYKKLLMKDDDYVRDEFDGESLVYADCVMQDASIKTMGQYKDLLEKRK